MHGFEEGGLDFGGGAVDFVGEQKIGEDRALAGGEGGVFGVVDEGANDIGGEEVGGEGDAVELEAEGVGEGLDGGGFGEAGDAFEEDVAAGDEADEEAVDEAFLADEDFGDFGAEVLDDGGLGGKVGVAHGFSFNLMPPLTDPEKQAVNKTETAGRGKGMLYESILAFV